MRKIVDFLFNNIVKHRPLVISLAAVVVFITTYMLILPALTLDEDTATDQGGIDVVTTEQSAQDKAEADSDSSEVTETESVQDNTAAADKDGDIKTQQASGSEPNEGTEVQSESSVAGEKNKSGDKGQTQPGTLSYEEKGYQVAIDYDKKAKLPEDTELTVTEIVKKDNDDYSLYREKALEAVREELGEDKVSGLQIAKFYDISLLSDGDEIQPQNQVDVTIDYDKDIKIEKEGQPQVIHFTEDEKTGEITASVLDEKDTSFKIKNDKFSQVSFTADSFSVYAVVYTVDFEYTVNGKTYQFSLQGGDKILLSELVEELGILKETKFESTEEFLKQVEDVAFSDDSLVKISKKLVGDDWTLKSLEPFTSEEKLTITMKNGDVLAVKVTDAATIDLSSLLTTVTVAGAEAQDDGAYKVEAGKNYSVHLVFAENDSTTFARTGSMTYQLPNGVKIPSATSGTIVPSDARLAEIYNINYTFGTNGLVTFTWVIKDGKQSEFDALTGGSIAFDITAQFDENATSVDWNGKGTYNIDKTKDISVGKTAWYSNEDGKMHYKISATAKGNFKDVELKDVITGSAVTLDQDSMHEVDNYGNTHLISYSDKSDKGFTATIAELKNGETVNIEYTATIDYNKLIADEGKTNSYGSITTTGNNVKYTGTDDNPNNDSKEAHVDNQISYSSAGKTVSEGVYENGKRTMNWQIKANEEHKATITYIKDTMVKGSDKMEYSGDGIKVKVYDKNGGSVGEYSRTWSELNVGSNSKSWMHTIPDEFKGEGYSYIVDYKTAVDVGDSTSSTAVSNEVETDYGKGSKEGSADPRPGQKHDFNKTVNNADIPNGEVTWDITIDVPETGLDECVVTDYLPRVEGTEGTFFDKYKSFTVDGLIDGEKVTTSTTTTTKTIDGKDKLFTDSVVFTFTKGGEPGLYPVSGGRQVILHVVTTLDEDWLNFDPGDDPSLAYYLNHTNTARHNNVDKSATVKIDNTEPGVIKKVGTQLNSFKTGSYSDSSVKVLPAWQYGIYVYGVSEDQFEDGYITITDTFDDRYLAYYQPNGGVITHAEDGNIGRFHQKLTYNTSVGGSDHGGDAESARDIDASVSGNKVTFKIPQSAIQKKDDGGYYPEYIINYYMHIKDVDTLENVLPRDAKAAGGVLKMNNTAFWDGAEPSSAEVTYEVPVISKSHKDLAGAGNYKFELKINENADKLGDTEFLTVTDTVSNLTVDYSSISFEPQGSVVSYNHSGNTITFIVRNQTAVTITYNASALVTGKFSNVMEMNGEVKTDGGDADVSTRGDSSFDQPLHIHILKHVEGNMLDVLPNVTFDIYKYSEDAENHWGTKLGTYTTGADGKVEVTVPHLNGNNNRSAKYVVHEVEPPEGFQRMPFDYYFTIDRTTANYGQYVYIENDTMPIANTPVPEDEIAIDVVKTWSGNAAGEKLPDVKIHLWAKDKKLSEKSTAEEVGSYTLTSADLDETTGKWIHRFEKLDATKTYFITEDPVPGYVASFTDANTLGLNRSGEIGVTNKKSEITVEKKWQDETGTLITDAEKLATLPDITVKLKKDGEVVETQKLKASENYKHTWSNLTFPGKYTVEEVIPEFDSSKQDEIEYTLNGIIYTNSDGTTVDSLNGKGTATITNNLVDKNGLRVTKKWTNLDGTNTTPDSKQNGSVWFKVVGVYNNGWNTWDIEKKELHCVDGVWETVTVENLPTTYNNTPVTAYRIVECGQYNDNYDSTIDGKAYKPVIEFKGEVLSDGTIGVEGETTPAGLVTINNTEVESTSITVKKVWLDDQQDHNQQISVQLKSRKKGTNDGAQNVGNSVQLPQNGKYEYTWTGLSTEYEYIVEENQVSGYTTAYSNKSDGNWTYLSGGTVIVTNCKTTTDDGSLRVKKVWLDSDGTEMKNPPEKSIKVQLQKAEVENNGVELEVQYKGNTKTFLVKKNVDVWVYVNAGEIESVTCGNKTLDLEKLNDWQEGYKINSGVNKKTIVFNIPENQWANDPQLLNSSEVSYVPSSERTWVDDGASVDLNSNNNWSHNFGQKTTQSENKIYYYRIQETVSVDDYTVSYENNNDVQSGYIYVKNTKDAPQTTSLTVQKRWQSNHATWNPDYGKNLTIYFKLYKVKGDQKEQVNNTIYQLTKDTKVNVAESDLGGDKAIVESKFTKNADGTYSIPFMITIPDLPVLKDGWQYAVVECNASGTEFEQGEDKTFWTCLEFNNTATAIKNDLTDVTATKSWNDQNVTGISHPAVTFSLYRTTNTIPDNGWKNESGYDHLENINWGDPIDTATIAADATGDALIAKWTDLPKYDITTGQLYTYYVKEATVDGYTLNSRGLVGGDKYQFTFENKLDDKTAFEFSKIWQDIGNRPTAWPGDATINITLNAYTNSATQTAVLQDQTLTFSPTAMPDGWSVKTSSDGKKTTFKVDGLAKYSNDGKELTYYVVEAQVDGYKAPSYATSEGNSLVFTGSDVPKATNGQQIINRPEDGYALPSTGGSGTRIFMIIGSIMILGAGALLVYRRRKLLN